MKSSLAAPMLAHARLRVAEWVSGPANVVWVLLAQASSQCHKPLDLSSGELERGMWFVQGRQRIPHMLPDCIFCSQGDFVFCH